MNWRKVCKKAGLYAGQNRKGKPSHHQLGHFCVHRGGFFLMVHFLELMFPRLMDSQTGEGVGVSMFRITHQSFAHNLFFARQLEFSQTQSRDCLVSTFVGNASHISFSTVNRVISSIRWCHSVMMRQINIILNFGVSDRIVTVNNPTPVAFVQLRIVLLFQIYSK